MFDFDEIEHIDPQLMPDDWVKVRGLEEQGLVLSYCDEEKHHMVFFTSQEQKRVARKDLQKLGDKERLLSYLSRCVAMTLDNAEYMAELRRMHQECPSQSAFEQRRELLVEPISYEYHLHSVDERWVTDMCSSLGPQNEDIAAWASRWSELAVWMTFWPPSPDAEPACPARRGRWVVVMPRQGLCSRLCTLVAARLLASDLGRELVVDWRLAEVCNCPLEQLVELAGGWLQLLDPALMRREPSLSWASRLNNIWSEVLKAAGSNDQACKTALTEFNECHKRAFRKRLCYRVDTCSNKWRNLPRLRGCAWEHLPDFLQVDAICVSACGWFYPPGPSEAAEAASECSAWLRALRPTAALAARLWQLPQGTISVNMCCGGDAEAYLPEHLFTKEMDARLAATGEGDVSSDRSFFLLTDDPVVEESMKEHYGPRLISQRSTAQRGTPESVEDTFLELHMLAQGDELLSWHGGDLSGLAALLGGIELELLVVDVEAEGGYFCAPDAAELMWEPDVKAKDPSETCGYQLRGSWDCWVNLTKLEPVPGNPKLQARARVRMGPTPGIAEFHVVKDGDLKQCFHPAVGCRLVLGPDDKCNAFWRVRVPWKCCWLEVLWEHAGGWCLSWRLLTADEQELAEEPEPELEESALAGPFFVMGSWDGWSSFTEMKPHSNHGFPFFALVRVRHPPVPEELVVTLGRDAGSRFHPARGSDTILGPDNVERGPAWRVDLLPRCQWLGIFWDPRGRRSLRCEGYEFEGGPSSPLRPSGQFFLVGSWNNWDGFLHLRPEATGNPHCRARFKVRTTPVVVMFQVVLDRNWEMRFWPSKKGNEILGPGDVHGENFHVNMPPGCRWLEVTWDPSGARTLHSRYVGEAVKANETLHSLDVHVRLAELQRLADMQEVPQASLGGPVPEVDLCIPHVYRYHCDGLDDSGWGCVYRNTQTLLEVLGHEVPTLSELTRAMGTGDAWLREPGTQCEWVEPHDVAEHLRRHASACRATRLLIVAVRGDLQLEATRTCKNGPEATYEVLWRPAGLMPESAEAKRQAEQLRALLAAHMARSRCPVLLDDTESAFLVAGYRWSSERGPEYRILDPHYGQTYAQRGLRSFDPSAGPDQFGPDDAKDQWVTAKWVEEGFGLLNGRAPLGNWMMLLVN